MNITILGAGLMGRLLACELARAGHTLTVFDAGAADSRQSAAFAAAAMLAPLAESAVAEDTVVRALVVVDDPEAAVRAFQSRTA